MLNEDFFYFFSMKEGWFAGDYIENTQKMTPRQKVRHCLTFWKRQVN